MESDNPFADYEPTISRVGKALDWLIEHANMLPSHVELCLSEHRGGSEMIDAELYDVPENIELGEE